MALTFRQVRDFLNTAETGRVSAAAAGFYVTQSAVTASIKTLEAELERKLFDRHSNDVTLTFDGQQFLQRARAIEASVAMRRGAHIAWDAPQRFRRDGRAGRLMHLIKLAPRGGPA